MQLLPDADQFNSTLVKVATIKFAIVKTLQMLLSVTEPIVILSSIITSPTEDSLRYGVKSYTILDLCICIGTGILDPLNK